MQNFPRQWPGPTADPQGARYAQWSQEKAAIAPTPFVEAYQPARLPPLGTRPQPDNVSAYSVDDFNIIRQYFYDNTKHRFRLDELGLRFSDPRNCFAIHREISKAIHDKYNIWIAKQDDKEFGETMLRAYINFFNINHRTGDLEEDLYNLNVMVIKRCIDTMLPKLELLIKQLLEIDRVPVPNPLPTNVNNRGLDGRSNIEMDRVLFLPLAEIQPPPQVPTQYAAIGNPASRNWEDQIHESFRY